ncbi:MAG: NAD-dependent epimerase/dehydratase family protein [Actinobacteria bacterium]|nr:NAD-dependent epimerase/dehydratase family protein [Actinomycetota bacterium]
MTQKVLVTGCGGELGSLATAMLEEESWVGRILGVDVDPPRQRLRRTDFRRIALNRTAAVSQIILDFDPHVIVHLGVWEPNARLSPDEAERTTSDVARAVFDAAHQAPSLEAVVVRSGLEVYGTRSHAPLTPTDTTTPAPASRFGRMLQFLERQAADLRAARGITVANLRLASVLGAHVPSPLGRLLRLPAVPFFLPSDPPFTVVEDNDAALAFRLAASHRFDGAINIAARGTTTSRRAALRGRRIPVPVVGPGWWVTEKVANLAGAPVPDHVLEMLQHGRLAHTGDNANLIKFTPRLSTHEVIERLYEWPSIIRVPATVQVA